MDVKRLAEIKERLEGTVIIGELYVKGDQWKGYEVIDDHNGMTIAELSNGTEAEFLANAPKDISELVAEVERLRSIIWRISDRYDISLNETKGFLAGNSMPFNDMHFAEIARLRVALEFYADEQSYEYEVLSVKEDGTEVCNEPLIFYDGGKRAREALRYGEG